MDRVVSTYFYNYRRCGLINVKEVNDSKNPKVKQLSGAALLIYLMESSWFSLSGRSVGVIHSVYVYKMSKSWYENV